jgi:tripeptide aminopeptidase
MVRKSTSTEIAEVADLEPNLSRALDLAMELMAIPGRSGQEGKVIDFITAKLRAAGVPSLAIRTDSAHKQIPGGGEVGNLVVTLAGTHDGPRRLFMAHMDTVPICVGAKPRRKGDRVISDDPQTGLGGDDRAGCAVILNTLLELVERKLPHPPLTFFWPVQEEVGLFGARFAPLKLLGKPKLAFNWDGGAVEKITIGATGGYRLAIDIEGLASHAGAAPEKGVSAIAIASLAIADLVENGWHGLVRKGSRMGTSNVGVFHGGEATNVVTDRVTIKAEARSHDPKFRARIVREMEKAFQRAAKRVKSSTKQRGKVTIEGRLDYESFRLAEDEACVVTAADAVRAIGLKPQLNISNGGLDANWMAVHGIPTVTLGCGQEEIHTTNEWLNIPAFENACRVGLRLAAEV